MWLSTARRRDVSGRLSYLPRPTYLPTHQPYLPHLPHPPTPARCEEPRRTKKIGARFQRGNRHRSNATRGPKGSRNPLRVVSAVPGESARAWPQRLGYTASGTPGLRRIRHRRIVAENRVTGRQVRWRRRNVRMLSWRSVCEGASFCPIGRDLVLPFLHSAARARAAGSRRRGRLRRLFPSCDSRAT